MKLPSLIGSGYGGLGTIKEPPKPPPTLSDKLVPINISQEEAQEEYQKYQPDTKTTALTPFKNVSPNAITTLDNSLRLVYKLAAEGARLVNIEDTFREHALSPRYGELRSHAHQDEELPHLAIAKAHWRRINCVRWGSGSLTFEQQGYNDGGIKFGEGTLRKNPYISTVKGEATVPLVPRGLRPDKLEDYTILWEPIWENKEVKAVDPILLQHVAGVIYRVVLAWDVTPIEAAVLKGLV